MVAIKFIKRILRKLGYDIVPIGPKHKSIIDPFYDIYYTLSRKGILNPIIFDIGSNVGDTISAFRTFYPKSTIHCFEPQFKCFEQLNSRFKGDRNLKINKIALGSSKELVKFGENVMDVNSSFFELDTEGQGHVINRIEIEVDTIENYCSENDIERINMLKIDTQGYDLEVLKGASLLIKGKKIDCILVELIFSKLYKQQPRFTEICDFMIVNGYKLVRFYDFHFLNEYAYFTDALFCLDDSIN